MSEGSGVEQVKKKIVTLTNDLEKFKEKATKCEKDAKELRDRAEKVKCSINCSGLLVYCLTSNFEFNVLTGRAGE